MLPMQPTWPPGIQVPGTHPSPPTPDSIILPGKKNPKEGARQGKVTRQAVEVPPPPTRREETLAVETHLGSTNGSSGEEDPMVNEAIHPFSIKSWIVVPETGVQGDVEAIIDTG